MIVTGTGGRYGGGAHLRDAEVGAHREESALTKQLDTLTLWIAAAPG